VWRWDQAEPFGNNPADEDPDANSVAFDLPLRLPGQRYDRETNLHYNYFRDYDPSLGRYGESDPIGLQGGLNTYAYVLGNPLSIFDLRGLMGSRGNPKVHAPLVCEGKWVNKGWDREVLVSQLGIQLCFCYWLCESCDSPTLWSGVKTDLPSTVNFMWFDARKRDSRDGDVETGNSCLCTRKPGPEKGCC